MKRTKIDMEQLVDILNDDNIQIKGIRIIDANNSNVEFDVEDEDYYEPNTTDIVPIKNGEYQKFKDQDKYIDEALLEMRSFEDDFDPIIKESIAMARVNNYILVESMGDEMADLYKRHLSTILEYNSQSMFHGFQGLKEDMSDYVRSLIVNKK